MGSVLLRWGGYPESCCYCCRWYWFVVVVILLLLDEEMVVIPKDYLGVGCCWGRCCCCCCCCLLSGYGIVVLSMMAEVIQQSTSSVKEDRPNHRRHPSSNAPSCSAQKITCSHTSLSSSSIAERIISTLCNHDASQVLPLRRSHLLIIYKIHTSWVKEVTELPAKRSFKL